MTFFFDPVQPDVGRRCPPPVKAGMRLGRNPSSYYSKTLHQSYRRRWEARHRKNIDRKVFHVPHKVGNDKNRWICDAVIDESFELDKCENQGGQ